MTPSFAPDPVRTAPHREGFVPLWLSQLDTAIRVGDEQAFRLHLPRSAPYTLSRHVFRDCSPLRAAVEVGHSDWAREVLGVSCEDEKAQVLVTLFTVDRLDRHEVYRDIWKSTDKGTLLETALISALNEELLSALLARVRKLPRTVYEKACLVAIEQRHPQALQELIAWNRRPPSEGVVEAAFRTHDPSVQRAVLSHLSDFGLHGAVEEAAVTGDLRALDQVEAEMEARALPKAQRQRHLSKALYAAIERADEPLWRWALPRADLNHHQGRALRDAVERGCWPWVEELLAKGARPHLAFGVWRDKNHWDHIHALARLVTPKQRAPWIRKHPDAMAPIQAWEREQRALSRIMPRTTRPRPRS